MESVVTSGDASGTSGDTEGAWQEFELRVGARIEIGEADRAKVTVVPSCQGHLHPETPLALKMVQTIDRSGGGAHKMRLTRFPGEGNYGGTTIGWTDAADAHGLRQIIIFIPELPADGPISLEITRVGTKAGHAGFALAKLV